jgi:hypothetical protein
MGLKPFQVISIYPRAEAGGNTLSLMKKYFCIALRFSAGIREESSMALASSN